MHVHIMFDEHNAAHSVNYNIILLLQYHFKNVNVFVYIKSLFFVSDFLVIQLLCM